MELLQKCIQNGNLEQFKKILETTQIKDIINVENYNRKNLLLMALQKKNFDFIKYILEKGANINHQYRKAKSKQKILMKSIREPNFPTQIFQFLLSKGADIHYRDETGSTPLLKAAQFGKTDLVKILLHHHPTLLEDKDQIGNTLLMKAIVSKNLELVKYISNFAGKN